MSKQIKDKLRFSLTIDRQKNFYLNQAAILRGCRAVSNISQRKAANLLGIAPSTLCLWEQRGCRDLAHCSRLADLYNQNIVVLIPTTYC